MAQRPASAVGTSRPASSLSRPSSAASHRTTSRLSTRPVSRLSQRPATRQSRALCQTLVTKLTGLVPDEDDDFEAAYDLALRRIESIAKQAASPDLQSALAQLKRFSKKACIQCDEELAEALDVTVNNLRAETEKRADLDNEISIAKLPAHLQFLFLLASQPSSSTLKFAIELLEGAHHPSRPTALTWAEILKEEPFEGQHWQGAYGLPAGSVVGQEEDVNSIDSSPTLSSISDAELDERGGLFSFPDYDESTEDSDQELTPPSSEATNDQMSGQYRTAESFRLRLELEALQRRQYWRKSWRPDPLHARTFDLGDPSTLRFSFESATTTDTTHHLKLEDEPYINEHDAVREALISLQGRQSILFEQTTDKNGIPFTTISKFAPKLLHLTPSAQYSILSTFAHLATTMCKLRTFLSALLRNTEGDSTQRTNCQTVEAFAEALELQINRFDARMAQREEEMLRAYVARGRNTVVSLLSLVKALRRDFSGSFDELLQVICISFPGSAWLSRAQILARVGSSPSSFSSQLLDRLFDMIQKKQSFGDTVTASILMRVFLRTGEPVWRMLGRWLRDGIFMPDTNNSVSDDDALPQEFFIESNGLGVTDCDFWACGYSLRSRSIPDGASSEYSAVPAFIRSLSESILGAGKSIGLLRILGHSGKVKYGKLSAAVWPTFEIFMMKLFDQGSLFISQSTDMQDITVSPDNLSMLLSDHLLPVCSSAEKTLKSVLFVECELLHHLDAVQDLFLSRKGDIIADFCDVLFSAIDAKKVWTDYHFLNTAFRETVDSTKDRRIDSSLVRLTYKASSRNALERSMRCFDGLTIEYAAPFPLIFILDSRASQVYNAIFVLLINIRRAKTSLDNILLRGSMADTLRSSDELKIFYAMRSKLSWFVNTLLNFVCSYVLQVETQQLRSSLGDTKSLDDIIKLHQTHLDTLEKLCFLDEETTALQRTLRSILDMSIAFYDCFSAFVGDNSLNTSRASVSRRHKHRSRRQRRQRLDVVSFAPISSFRVGDDDSDDSSDSDLDASVMHEISEDIVNPTFAAPSAYESFSAEDFFDQNEKMAKDLDSRVRYIRREVERLASNSSRSQFGILAFSLQDWDL